MQQLIESLELDEELGKVFQDLRKNGAKAAMRYSDEALMMNISLSVQESSD